MSKSLQLYVSQFTRRAAEDFEKAYLNIPQGKRIWTPSENARSANDQLAEIGLLHYNTAYTLLNKERPPGHGREEFMQRKAELADNGVAALALYHKSLPVILEAIKDVKDEELDFVIQYPWGPETIASILSYPQYNLTYHEGQINYIASILGCL